MRLLQRVYAGGVGPSKVRFVSFCVFRGLLVDWLARDGMMGRGEVGGGGGGGNGDDAWRKA